MMHLGLPLIWGYLADRTQKHGRVLQLVCLGAFLASTPLLWVESFSSVVLTMLGLALFNVNIVGLIDTQAQEQARNGKDYGQIRLWGSVSFMLSSMALGLALSSDASTDHVASGGTSCWFQVC